MIITTTNDAQQQQLHKHPDGEEEEEQAAMWYPRAVLWAELRKERAWSSSQPTQTDGSSSDSFNLKIPSA